ncbi:MAG: hypothetical protein IPL95_12085 [Saprospiraceae bacterium]|nr:hypothetical protein [Saprospiraceae bacterium]
MKRKEFIKVCGAACLSASPLMILLESCGLSNYYAHYAVNNKKNNNQKIRIPFSSKR